MYRGSGSVDYTNSSYTNSSEHTRYSDHINGSIYTDSSGNNTNSSDLTPGNNLYPTETVNSVFLYYTFSGDEVSLSYFLTCVLTLVLALWIIFLNRVIVVTLTCHKRTAHVSDFLVSALSIADLVTGLTLIYITTYSLLQYQNLWECLFRFGLTYTVSHSSHTHLLAITIDRYIKVVYPLSYETIFTKGRVFMLSAAIWIFSITMGLLPLFGWHNKFRQLEGENETVCRFFGILQDSYYLTNLLISSFMMLVTVMLYSQIVCVARQQYRMIRTQAPEMSTSNFFFLDDHSLKLAKTIGIVVVVSNLCWAPGVTVILLHVTGMLDSLSLASQGDLITYCSLTVFLNSLINPLIYAAKIDSVNKQFRVIFRCKQNNHLTSLSSPG